VGNISDVRRFFALPDRAHELSVRLANPSDAGDIAKTLARLPGYQGLDVKTWAELRPDVVAMVQTNTAFTAMMVAIIFAVAAIGVADTILMAVFERRRELGVMKAVGMRPGAIIVMIATETFLLGLGAALVGLGFGVGVDTILGRWGIPLGHLSGFSLAGAAIPPVLHAALTLEGALLPVLMMLVMALLASLWPAFVAARVQPVVAMSER
jgi:ABC-type lipoprotein release transport system permease subunit